MKVIGTVHDLEVFALDPVTVGIRQLPDVLSTTVHVGIEELTAVVALLRLAAEEADLSLEDWPDDGDSETDQAGLTEDRMAPIFLDLSTTTGPVCINVNQIRTVTFAEEGITIWLGDDVYYTVPREKDTELMDMLGKYSPAGPKLKS